MHILTIMYLFPADVKHELDDLTKTMKNFEARVGLAKDLETISSVCCITTSRLPDEILHEPKMGTDVLTLLPF